LKNLKPGLSKKITTHRSKNMRTHAPKRRKETRKISVVGQEAPPNITISMVTLNCRDRK
jgi:hypothetical protein